MDTTLNDVLAWWADRPAGESMVIFMAALGFAFCLGKAFEMAVRLSERKRIADSIGRALVAEAARERRLNNK